MEIKTIIFMKPVRLKLTASVAILLFLCGSLYASPQDSVKRRIARVKVEEPITYGPRTLTNQFVDLKERSNTYQEYKVIKLNSLNVFWKNIYDSLSASKVKLTAAQHEIRRQKQEIANLNKSDQKRVDEIKTSEYDKAHITVLGIDFLKENYIYLSWAIIIALIVGVVMIYFKYINSNKIAEDKRKEFDLINNELNDFKQKSREKELKMGRELQTERNRVEELNQKVTSLKKQVHL